MDALKLVTQVVPAHQPPRARTEYPPGRGEHGHKCRFFVLHQGWAHEGCCYPAKYRPGAGRGRAAHFMSRVQRRYPLRQASLRAKQKWVCEMSVSPGATAAFKAFSAKCPVPSPEPLCSPPALLPPPPPTHNYLILLWHEIIECCVSITDVKRFRLPQVSVAHSKP